MAKVSLTFNKLITFCDRLDGTVSENIYFKFVVKVMWEPVPGSTLMKLCPLAQRDSELKIDVYIHSTIKPITKGN